VFVDIRVYKQFASFERVCDFIDMPARMNINIEHITEFISIRFRGSNTTLDNNHKGRSDLSF
jgi:hypothetical protein